MSEYPSYLIHYGVPGQKWGTRQYQNLDGTWTEEGKRRRRIGDDRDFGKSEESVGYRYKTGGAIKGDKAFVKDIQKDIQKVNGGNKGFEYGLNRNVNCAFCTMSYELRRRGYDVRAQESLRGAQAYLSNPKGAYGRVIPNYAKISKDARTFATRSSESLKMMNIGMTKNEYDDMTSKILSDGDNTRGFIAVDWKGGNGGHIFNYEVRNGQLYFIDAQPGTIVKADKRFFNQTMKNANNVETLRSDNLKIDEEKAKKFYSEDATGDIRYNSAKIKSDKVRPWVAAVSAGLMMSVTGMPFAGIAIGNKIVDKLYDKKIKDIDDQASIELQNKWESEGRFKNKWYDFKEDKKKDSKSMALTEAKQSRIKSLISSGKTQKEVAKLLGISMSTVNKYK